MSCAPPANEQRRMTDYGELIATLATNEVQFVMAKDYEAIAELEQILSRQNPDYGNTKH